MKNLFTKTLIVLGALISSGAYAQSPEGVQYQAVVRNSAGEVIASTSVGMQLSILQGSSSGSSVYSETHTVSTNGFGLVNLQLGDGTSSDVFADIDWSDGPYFIKVEVDPAGGSSYVTMGTSELLSVPYALHAKNVENDSVMDDDADPSNELLIGASLVGTDLDIEDAGGTISVDLSGLVDDDDADPSNELLTSASLSGTDFDIEDAGGTITVDLSSLVDDEDADSTNEYQNISFANDELTLSGGGGSVMFPYDSSYWDISDDTVYIEDLRVAVGGSEGGAMLNAHNVTGSGTNTAFYSISNTTGLNRGVLSYARSSSGNASNQFGVVGLAQNDVGSSSSGTGVHVGVSGEAYADDGDNYGVQAYADGGGANNFGMRGSSGDSATIRNYGGYFSTAGQANVNWNIGVLSIADGSHTGTNYGIYSLASGASTNYAAYLSGDVTYTGTLASASDRALKNDVELYSGAIDKVKNIGTYTYSYKVDEYAHMNLPKGEQIGFIAQDLEEVYPTLVTEQHAPTEEAAGTGDVDGASFTVFKGVNYVGMIPVLTQAIKEQQTMIEEQKALIEALESRIEALEE